MLDVILHLDAILFGLAAFLLAVCSLNEVQLQNKETLKSVTHTAAYARMSVAAGTAALPGFFLLNPPGFTLAITCYVLMIGWMFIANEFVRHYRALPQAETGPDDIRIVMAPDLPELLPKAPSVYVGPLDPVGRQLLSYPDAQIVWIDGRRADPDDPDGNLDHLTEQEMEAWNRWADENLSTDVSQESRRRQHGSRKAVNQMSLQEQAAYWKAHAERLQDQHRELIAQHDPTEPQEQP